MSRQSRWAQLGRVLVLGVMIPMLASCASSGGRERELARLAEFESVAGEPISSFHFWQLRDFETLGPEHVAVWTRVNEAYLIEVRTPCNGLAFATRIGLSSSQNRVTQAFDAVRFERERCPIAQIRKVDGKALKALRREKAQALAS